MSTLKIKYLIFLSYNDSLQMEEQISLIFINMYTKVNNVVTDQMPNPTIGGEAKKMIFCNFWASLTKPLHMKLNHDTFIHLRCLACQNNEQTDRNSTT